MNWISVDFGTYYSSASVLIDGTPVKVRPLDGLYEQFAFPTVAYIEENKTIHVCNDALKWRCQDLSRFHKEFKLDIHQGELSYLNITYREIITKILENIKKSAEFTLGNEIANKLLLTFPASYEPFDPRLTIMKLAAQAAGFKQIEILKEPKAAAIYYDYLQKEQNGSFTLIYDLGGGTFDPALIEHSDSGYKLLGNAEGIACGGKFFDEIIYQYFQEHFPFEYSENEEIQIRQMDELNQMCRFVKERLSDSESVQYPIPHTKNQIFQLTRQQFVNLITPILEKTFNECSEIIVSAHKNWDDIDRILLIGGSSAIPCVRELLYKYLEGRNLSKIPIIISNKSEEGRAIDSLFAVSLGGIIYIQNKYYSIENDTISKVPLEPKVSDFEIGMFYLNANDLDRNWILAAYYFIQDYKNTSNIESYNSLIQIFQKIVDNLSVEDCNIILKPLYIEFGESSLDYLVEFIIQLQKELNSEEMNSFIEKIYEVSYWSGLTEKIVRNNIN